MRCVTYWQSLVHGCIPFLMGFMCSWLRDYKYPSLAVSPLGFIRRPFDFPVSGKIHKTWTRKLHKRKRTLVRRKPSFWRFRVISRHLKLQTRCISWILATLWLSPCSGAGLERSHSISFGQIMKHNETYKTRWKTKCMCVVLVGIQPTNYVSFQKDTH